MTDQTETPEITSDDKLWALLIYMFSPLVPIIVLLLKDKKNRPFIREHNMQSLILGNIILSFVPLLIWIYMIYLGLQAYRGKSVTIPLITNLVKNHGWA